MNSVNKEIRENESYGEVYDKVIRVVSFME